MNEAAATCHPITRAAHRGDSNGAATLIDPDRRALPQLVPERFSPTLDQQIPETFGAPSRGLPASPPPLLTVFPKHDSH